MKATRRPAKPADHVTRVIGYIRVSTADQSGSGLGLEAQRQKIAAECARRGWELIEISEDAGVSGKGIDRPALQKSLQALADGEADALMCAKLDRLSRSVKDVCAVGDMAQAYGWNLILLDCDIDTTTPSGEFMLNLMANVAQLERRMISQRTKDALAVKKAQGFKLGRPEVIAAEIVNKVRQLHSDGLSIRAIVKLMNEEGIEPTEGSKFHVATVQRILKKEDKIAA
jgi:DNA invertase Pin-like site-specific DNA recombinase